jgi:hypothetical protein
VADKVDFELEKWKADVELRKRELALKENEHKSFAWRSPITVAIFAAAAAALGNAVVAMVNTSLQRGVDERKHLSELALERSKAESTRILEMIKTGKEEEGVRNLRFLIKSGLVADKDLVPKIQNFVDAWQPGTGPVLPAPSARIGFERSQLLTEALQSKLEATLTRYISYLEKIGFTKPDASVTVAVEAMDTPNAYYMVGKNRIVIDHRLADDPSVALREYSHHVLIREKSFGTSSQLTAIESGLADYFSCSFLNTPNVGEKVGAVFQLPTSYLRTLKHNRTFAEMTSGVNRQQVLSIGEIWGGFFWDLREQIEPAEPAAADSLVAAAWLSFQTPANAARVFPDFGAALLKAAETKGPRALEVVKAAAAARKLPGS